MFDFYSCRDVYFNFILNAIICIRLMFKVTDADS